VAARWPSGRDFGGHARHCVGSCSLLCRHHGCELEIPLHPPFSFFNRDYSVFDGGGMAFSEGNLKPFVRLSWVGTARMFPHPLKQSSDWHTALRKHAGRPALPLPSWRDALC
jgi:hypothetical protein